MNFVELRPGKSVEGTDIKSFRTDIKSNKYIYLMAGVHGDEVEGVYVLEKLFEWLKNLQEDLPIVVIPVLNIDGYRLGTRVNSRGVDLNRNLNTECWSSEFSEKKYYSGSAPLSEPENKYLVNLFNKYSPGIILSIHSWKALINYNGDCKDLSDFMSSKNGYKVVDDIGYPTPGSLGTLGPMKMNCPVVTFECPTLESNKTLSDIWNENEKAFKGIFEEKKYQRFLD